MICGRLLRSVGICQQEDTRYRSEHVESAKHAAFTIVCPLCSQGPMDLQYAYRKRHKNAYMVQHHLDPKIIAEQPEETWLRPAECRLGNLSLKGPRNCCGCGTCQHRRPTKLINKGLWFAWEYVPTSVRKFIVYAVIACF